MRPAPRPALAFSPSRRRFTVLGGGTLLALSGCGGGDGGEEPLPSAPPPPPAPPAAPVPPPPPGSPPDTLPVITAQPQSVMQAPGTPVTLRVEASGPNLSYQWKRSGTDIAGATAATLEVANVAGAVERYSVTVRNGAGSVDSVEVTVTAAVALERLSLVAGGLGGGGLLEGRGKEARLPIVPVGNEIVATPSGTVYFLSGTLLARVKVQGDLEYFPAFGPTSRMQGLAVDDRGTVYCFEPHVIRKLVEGVNPSFAFVAGVEGWAPGLVDGVGSAARMNNPLCPVAGANGVIYFIDNGVLRRLSADGAVTTVAGNPANRAIVDGQGSAAGFGAMRGLVSMPDGNLLVLDGAALRRVTPEGAVTTLPGAAVPNTVGGLIAADATSVFATVGHRVIRLGLDGSVTTVAGSEEGYFEGVGGSARFAFFYTPDLRTLGRLPTGEVLVYDCKNALMRKIDLATLRTSNWLGAPEQAATVDGMGDAARFYFPRAVALDASGNAYVVERARQVAAGSYRAALRKVTPDGVVSTVHQDFPADGGLAIDAAGNFYGARGRSIVKVTPAGVESLVAGKADAEPGFADGPAAEARFTGPAGMAFDRQGNLFVGDAPLRTGWDGMYTWTYGRTVRKITPSGQVSTFAGVPGGSSPDFWVPAGLATDAAGNVYVMDAWKNVIRRIGPEGGASELLVSTPGGLSGLAVTPAGTVYYHARAEGGYAQTVRRRLADGSSQRIAGGDLMNAEGVRTGALPGALNAVTGMTAATDGTLYVLSENSLLKIGPA